MYLNTTVDTSCFLSGFAAFFGVFFKYLDHSSRDSVHSCGYAQQQHKFWLSGLVYTMSNCPHHLTEIRWKAKSPPNEQELQMAALQAWQTVNKHIHHLVTSVAHRFLFFSFYILTKIRPNFIQNKAVISIWFTKWVTSTWLFYHFK